MLFIDHYGILLLWDLESGQTHELNIKTDTHYECRFFSKNYDGFYFFRREKIDKIKIAENKTILRGRDVNVWNRHENEWSGDESIWNRHENKVIQKFCKLKIVAVGNSPRIFI